MSRYFLSFSLVWKGSHMDDGKMKLFMLLQQIGMTDDQYVIHFEHAELESRRDSSEVKGMAIQFNLDKTIASECIHDIFPTCERSLCGNRHGFNLHITSANPEMDERLLTDYWPFVIEEMSVMSPPIRERLTGQRPVMTGGKMTLYLYK